jgi:hypothetical protein
MMARARALTIRHERDDFEVLDGPVRRYRPCNIFDVTLELVCDEEFASKLAAWLRAEGVNVPRTGVHQLAPPRPELACTELAARGVLGEFCDD